MSTLTIAFVTGNAAKVETARQHLAPFGIDVEQVTLDLDEIQSPLVRDVALHKAQQAFRVLRRPLIVEDSGFYIDELGFPGPLVKQFVRSVGSRGIIKLADLTSDRRCHFEGVLVYIDGHGVPRVYTDSGDGGTVAREPADKPHPGAWSPLWDVFIPTGCDKPLSALSAEERERVFAGWAKSSVFAQFGEALDRKMRARRSSPAGRLRSTDLNFDFPDDRIAVRPRPTGEDLLLVLDRGSGKVEHRRFIELPQILPPRSLVVVNNSAVVRAALRRVPDDGTYLHIVDPFHSSLDDVVCLCPWKPSVGTVVGIRGGHYMVEGVPDPGRDLRIGRLVPDDPSITNLTDFMAAYGEVPIPIYVNARRDPDNRDVTDYQNVYASVPGSVACPTAGLHLRSEVIESLRAAGHEIVEVTLHIGYG
ncbi:MAG: S-adenosylmethionine:tRNA ribosyltransferase-isomerase, partial [Dactylosporangium sp.]|nr:S-adenosylmethionine:tRNA ribosyltransferase-isomerase [Dactylosporangium sp.]